MRFVLLTIQILLAAPVVYSLDTLQLNTPFILEINGDGGFGVWNEKSNVVHLKLMDNLKGAIQIKNPQNFALFLNNNFVSQSHNSFLLSIDSLKKEYAFPLLISIFSRTGVSKLSTVWIIPDISNSKFENHAFRDTVIVYAFILLIALAAIFRLNPQSTLQYFNLLKVFSIRSYDDNSVNVRVLSANNILLYIFTSSLLALHGFLFFSGAETSVQGWDGHFLTLFSSITLVFCLLISKSIIVGISAWVFKLGEFAQAQFYNFVLLLLVSFTIAAIALLFNFMVGESYFQLMPVLSILVIGMIVTFIVVTYFKLIGKRAFNSFHLFSYLCASEIIPLIILLNLFS